MSCIATIYTTTEEKYASLAVHAKNIATKKTGWWIFGKKTVVGETEFNSAFNRLLCEDTTFNYSGFVMLELEEIGSSNPGYFVPPEITSETILERIFGYGGYIFRSPHCTKVPSDEIIVKHLNSKRKYAGADSVNAIRSAYDFFNRAASLVKDGNISIIGLY